MHTVLAADASADVLRRYDNDLDAAFEEARDHDDVTPLMGPTLRGSK